MIRTLQRLRDIGNTVIVVEHDEETIRAADHIIEMGPGPGVHGGEVVAQGPLEEILPHPALADRPVPERPAADRGAGAAARRRAGKWLVGARRAGEQSQER